MITPLMFIISLVLLLRRFKSKRSRKVIGSYMLHLQSGLFIRSLLMEATPSSLVKVFN